MTWPLHDGRHIAPPPARFAVRRESLIGRIEGKSRAFFLPARVVAPPRNVISFSQDMTRPKTIVLSLGTSNKSLSHFVKELKNYKIATLIDVRDTPQSRFFPHFNRK